MICADSREFFEISISPQPDNTAKARLLCVADFGSKCLKFPLVLIGKACKTVVRFFGMAWVALWLFVTLGSSKRVRERFVEQVIRFARDLADWILLPLALILRLLRLVAALLIHPRFYFNAL